MLPLKDGAVVDPRLSVYGVRGLRVVDCRIIPRLPDVNIQVAVFMIEEKGAMMTREDWVGRRRGGGGFEGMKRRIHPIITLFTASIQKGGLVLIESWARFRLAPLNGYLIYICRH